MADSDSTNQSSYSNGNFTMESNYDEVVDSFDALKLNEDLLRGIYSYGFERP